MRNRTQTTRPTRIAPALIVPLALACAGTPATAAWASSSSASTAASATLGAQRVATPMVVNRDGAAMRCGDEFAFYIVARLDAGTVLTTDGESGDYTRVVVPADIGGFVPVSEAEAIRGGDSVRLITDSRLRAPSQLSGLSGAWKQLYTQALPAGTELELIETLTNEAGAVVGFRVVAPLSPSGEPPIAFVLSEDLRPALASESGGSTSPTPPQTDDTPSDPQPDEPVGEPVPEPQTDEGTEPPSDTEPAKVDDSLLEEQVTTEMVEIQNSSPVDRETDEVVITATEARIPTSELEALEAAFVAARGMPRAELDEALDELLAEFGRTRAEAGEDESLARALDQRIEWVNIRIETRDQRRRIAEALAQYDAAADETAIAIDAWQRGRAYQLVGRMVTSSVYTGANLPLLYRVQGVDPITGTPRTIGYIAPKQDQDLRHMLGRVVGVLGVMRDDESLGLRVVEPERVDIMPE